MAINLSFVVDEELLPSQIVFQGLTTKSLPKSNARMT
jgi:hypothetical protein